MTDMGYFPSMWDHGAASQAWMAKMLVGRAESSLLRAGVQHMIDYMDQHLDHADDEDNECQGPDWGVALDILLQISTTAMYIQPYDPDEYPDGPPPIPKTDEEIEKTILQFKEALGIEDDDEEEE